MNERYNTRYLLRFIEKSRCHSEEALDLLRLSGYKVKGFSGWTEPGEFGCPRCATTSRGITRKVVGENWCDHCGKPVYPSSDPRWLHETGSALYRARVKRCTRYALNPKYVRLIAGAEHIYPGKRYLRDGWSFHRDHIFSVCDAFHNDVEEEITGSPVNVRIISVQRNLMKNRKSDISLEALLNAHREFIATYPQWLRTIASVEGR